MKHQQLVLGLSLAVAVLATAPARAESVETTVIDVGQGLATVTAIPGGHYFIYDTGHWYPSAQRHTLQTVQAVVPADEEIDLLILSHSDADHLAATDEILAAYPVRRIIRTGLERTTTNWGNADDAIAAEQAAGAAVINLKYDELPPGASYRLGQAWITILAGAYAPPPEWGLTDPEGGEFRNAGSIVAKLTYAGRSILFAGDAVGRHIDDPDDALIATEKYLVENHDYLPLTADVLIAPHHGADNGSSTAFIRAVDPSWVIFSAGRGYRHPRAASALRYLNHGIAREHILRTDRGDHEQDHRDDPNYQEWDYGRIPDHRDASGDDDIVITVSATGQVEVAYKP